MAASIRLEDLVAINRQMRAVDLTVKMLSSVPYGLLPDYYKQLGKEADVVVPGSPALAAPVEISEPAHCTPAPTGRWLEDKIDDVRDRLAAIEVLTRRVIKLEADHQKIDARLDYWEVGGITPAVLPLNRAWLGDCWSAENLSGSTSHHIRPRNGLHARSQRHSPGMRPRAT
jgi:hypothetical protein